MRFEDLFKDLSPSLVAALAVCRNSTEARLGRGLTPEEAFVMGRAFAAGGTHSIELLEKELVAKGYKIVRALLLFFIIAAPAEATVPKSQPIAEASAVRAIAGEASGESYAAKVAHAHAIRNRGHLGGVYGLHAPHVNREPARVIEECRRAWRESVRSPDTTRGADHWFSDADIEKLRRKPPAWFLRLEPTVRVGGTTFYRRRR